MVEVSRPTPHAASSFYIPSLLQKVWKQWGVLVFFVVMLLCWWRYSLDFHASLLAAANNHIDGSHHNEQQHLSHIHNLHSHEKKDAKIKLPKYMGNLQCQEHGGPSDDKTAREMVYWRDIPQDAKYQSPYHDPKQRKYLTVEVDEGGWNNIRMTVEIAMALAHATGRTFVLPPRQGMYLLDKSYSLHDFYDLDGLDVLEMKDFLETEILTGNLRNKEGRRVLPPHNRTDWRVRRKNGARELDYFLRTVGESPRFMPIDKLMFVPSKPTSAKKLQKWHAFGERLYDNSDDLMHRGVKFYDDPVPVNATATKRLSEMLQHRKLWLYSKEIHSERLIHFMAQDDQEIRIHGNFYHALFFQDYKMDLVVKRYIRDRLRYRDNIFCAAARVVQDLRQISQDEGNGGDFYTYHVRRNDFAWIHLAPSAYDIYWRTFELVPKNATVYVATDERDKQWFQPFVERFGSVHYLDDFGELFQDEFNSNYYGILDQIIAAHGTRFFGAFYSTLTMHTMHIKGHLSQLHKSPGWELGLLMDSYYHTPMQHRDFFRHYQPIQGDVYAYDTAFPIGWRDIDFGI